MERVLSSCAKALWLQGVLLEGRGRRAVENRNVIGLEGRGET